MTDSGAITARGIKVSFGGRKVLDSLDLTLAQGDVVGLLGANGVGKTTLLKSLLGLQPLDAGRCTILGEPAASLSPAARAHIAYVPQTCGQFPWLTGQRMLRYVSAFYPVFDWDYARDLSARWRLALRTPVGALSPGQQQRLSIVRALSTRPDVLILDEPIASLDPATRIAVIDELIQERARRPLSIIFSSHLIGDLERLCSKLAIMVAGKIAVIEEMAWFSNLARATLEGEASALADLSIPRAALVRNAAATRRVVIVARDDVQRLAAELPPSVRMTVDEPDVEVLASEWMQ